MRLNRYVHDACGYDPSTKEMKRVIKTADKVLKFTFETFTVAEVHALHDKIVALIMASKLDRFCRRAWRCV